MSVGGVGGAPFPPHEGAGASSQQQEVSHAISTLEQIISAARQDGQDTVPMSQLTTFYNALSTIIHDSSMPATIQSMARNLESVLNAHKTTQGISLAWLSDAGSELEKMLTELSNN